MIATTDGMLSGEISADLNTFKMIFFGDWLFLFAGTLSNADLIMESIRHESLSKELTRHNIQTIVRRAYKKRFSEWAADRNLSPYDFEMNEFKESGLKTFGEKVFSDMDYSIRQDADNFKEEVLVTGWGKNPASAMIFGMNREGGHSQTLNGFATIGSGGNVAANTLMLLGCARHVPFEYALYAVAAAKFSAESCDGVGRTTAMVVTHKSESKDDKGYKFIQPSQLDQLRELWERHSRPRVPNEAFQTLSAIAQEVVGEVTSEAMIRSVQESMRSIFRK